MNSWASGLAALALLLPGCALAQTPDERIGAAAAVRGSVQLAALGPSIAGASGAIGVNIASGTSFYLRDRIESGPDSGMQILLADETAFTIGPNSSLAIDEFVYNPAGGTGRLTANVARGAFRFVSGKVAASGQDAMRITTPAATIGVRGTVGGGIVDASGTKAALFGRGSLVNEGTRPGSLGIFSNGLPNQPATPIRAPGFTSFVAPNAPPTPPVFDPAFLQQISGAVAVQPAPPQQSSRASGSIGSDAVAGPGVQTRDAPDLLLPAVLADVTKSAIDVVQAPNSASDIARLFGFGVAIPQNVQLPLAVQMSWSTIPDLDLHLTGPDGSGRRFHVFFSNPGSFGTAPFARLSQDRTGVGGSEVIAINGLTTTNLPGDANYRASVFNFGDSASNSTSLSVSSGAVMSVIRNGTINLAGSSGHTISGGTVITTISIPGGGQPGDLSP